MGSQAVPPAQGVRVLGLDVNGPPANYATSYAQAMTLGAREVSVSLDWALLEPSVGTYVNTLPAIIENFYPTQSADLTLVLRPLDTPGPRLPTGLTGAFDGAAITAFENFLINLHAQMPALNASGKLKWIHVGNEIDAWLGTDTARWAQWKIFFDAAKLKIESLWGAGVNVSSVAQFGVLSNSVSRSEYLSLLPSLDSAVLTYYPLNTNFTMRAPSVVATDFDSIVSAITSKPIILQECGYSSSATSNSSELIQANFVTAVFDAWDIHRDRISLIDFTWQFDVDSTAVDQWVLDFGMTGATNEAEFRAYLGTLGLSNQDGSEKLALQRLRDELQARAWGL